MALIELIFSSANEKCSETCLQKLQLNERLSFFDFAHSSLTQLGRAAGAGRGGPGRDKQQVTRPRPVCGWARPAATRRTPRRGRPARRTCRSPAPRLLPVPACGAAAARAGPQRPHEHSNFTILPQNLVRVPIKDKEDSCSRGHR